MMNCEQTQQHWDAYRDNELTGSDRAAFEQHLRDCAACGELWRREALWLQAMAETPRDLADPFHAADFAEQVIDEWQRPCVSVIGRIVRWTAIAACLLIVGTIALVVINAPRGSGDGAPVAGNQQPAKIDTPGTPDGAVAQQTPDDAIDPDAEPTDPVSVLVLDVNKQISEQPAQIRHKINETASMFSVNQFVAMLGPRAPKANPDNEQR